MTQAQLSPLCTPGAQQGWLFGVQEAGDRPRVELGPGRLLEDSSCPLGIWGLHAIPSTRAALHCSLMELATRHTRMGDPQRTAREAWPQGRVYGGQVSTQTPALMLLTFQAILHRIPGKYGEALPVRPEH